MTTRIQFEDLPRLEDLTPEQLKELFGAGRNSYKPSYEVLEDRRLMSVFSSVLGSSVQLAVSDTAVSTAAPVASTLNPSIQAIPWDTVALQTPASPDAILQQDATGDPYFQQTDPARLNTLLQQAESSDAYLQPMVAGRLSQPTEHVLDDPSHIATQEDGRIAIANKVAALRSALGNPLPGFEDSQPTADGIGRFQAFQGGSIYWSPATAKNDVAQGLNPSTAGAHVIRDAIRDKYLQEGATQFGYPTTDTSILKGLAGATFNSFHTPNNNFSTTDHQRDSMIVFTPGAGAFVLSGEIMYKWIQLGAGRYGGPIGNKYDSQGVFSQDFRWGGPGGPVASIVWSEQTGAHDVVGAIRDSWIARGASTGFGNPVTDSTVFAASGNGLNQIVHFKKDGHGAAIAYLAYGPVAVYGNIYVAWISIGGAEKFGWPTSEEKDGFGSRFSTFLSRDGKERAIFWSDPKYSTTFTTFQVYDDQGLHQLDFDPIDGPTGFEPVAGATGATGAPLTADPPLDLSGLFQDSTHATDTTGLHTLDLSGLFQDSTHAIASTASLWQSSDMLQAGSADYASLFAGGLSASPGDPTIPSDPVIPSDPIEPFSGGLSFQAATAFGSEVLQARLGELDQAVAQSQQDLQGALDVQAQYTAERERIEADVQAATEVSPDETAPNLVDLQASQVQNATALEQNQQQITMLQTQLDLYTAEQALIGSALAEADVAGDQQQAPLSPLDQSLTQVRQDLLAGQDAQAQVAAESQHLADQIPTANRGLTDAEQALAGKSANLARAENELAPLQAKAQQSAQAFQARAGLDQALNTRLTQANTAYQQAQKALKANHVPKLRAKLQLKVNQTKAGLGAATTAFSRQHAATLAAQTVMNADAQALQEARAARDLAQQEFDAAGQLRQQAFLDLADLQTAQAQADAAGEAWQQQVAGFQARVDDLAAQQAEVQGQLAQAEADAGVS